MPKSLWCFSVGCLPDLIVYPRPQKGNKYQMWGEERGKDKVVVSIRYRNKED